MSSAKLAEAVTSPNPHKVFCLSSPEGAAFLTSSLPVTDPLPVLKPPANVTSPRGARAVLVCQVEGSTRYNMTWRRDGQRLGTAGTGRAQVLRNSSLEIDPVGPQDVGEYQCVASNTQGQSRASVWLLVPGEGY